VYLQLYFSLIFNCYLASGNSSLARLCPWIPLGTSVPKSLFRPLQQNPGYASAHRNIKLRPHRGTRLSEDRLKQHSHWIPLHGVSTLRCAATPDPVWTRLKRH